jgi:hypothetical protein
VADLTRAEIRAQVLLHAFNANDVANANTWISQVERRVWGLVDWPFKEVDLTSLTVTANDPTPTLPADYARVTQLLNHQREPLVELDRDQFDERGLSDSDSTGIPSCYTVIGRSIVLGPYPDAGYTFQMRYERLLSHRDSTGAITVGAMDEEDDYPFWTGHELLLVHGARAIGKGIRNDPSQAYDQQEYDAALLDMISDYFPASRGPRRYGRDRLGE